MLRFFTIVWLASVALLAAEPIGASELPDAARSRAMAATVTVTSEADGQFGSGVAIAQSDGHTYILTACHILTAAKKVDVKVPGGKAFTAEVLARSSECDLAVLRIPATKGLPAALKLSEARAKPKDLFSIGWEKGDAPTCLEESLKDKVRLKKPGESNSVWCWEVERKPAAGRSGGPLIDERSAIVGIASGHDGNAGYYVHIDEIRAFLRLNGLNWLAEEAR